jgi:hypothetical protein
MKKIKLKIIIKYVIKNILWEKKVVNINYT